MKNSALLRIGSFRGSFDHYAGADGLASGGLSLFFLCLFAGGPASCTSSSLSSGQVEVKTVFVSAGARHL